MVSPNKGPSAFRKWVGRGDCREAWIDFVKIDAEGAEEGVIAGMMVILTRDHPGLILEFNAARYRDPRGFLDQLQAIYSRMGYVDYNGNVVSISAPQVINDRRSEDWLLYFDQPPPLAQPRIQKLTGPGFSGHRLQRN
jgi:hypothetical protein